MNSLARRNTLTFVLVLTSGLAFAGFSPSEWEFHKRFTPDTSQPYTRLAIDPETFDKARVDVADLRVIDSSGKELPYQLVKGTEWHTRTELGARILNNSYLPGKYSVVVIDLGRKGLTHNLIHLDVTSHNFTRNVEVLGSDDRTHWFVLRDDAAICDFSSKDDTVKIDRITYPESIYRYIQVRVLNGQDAPLAIRHPRVIAESTPARVVRRRTPVSMMSFTDARRKQSIIIVDAGYRNLPLSGIVLSTEDKNFYRSVQVMAGNDTAHMASVHTDVLYRYDTPRFSDERLALEFAEVRGRYLKLVVFNHDDQPVHFSVQQYISPEYTIVMKSTAEPLELFFGNAKAAAPVYDLQHTLQYVDLQHARIVSPGPIAVNPLYAPVDTRPWTERNPVLLWIVFGVVFVVLAFLIIRMVRTAPPPK